MVKLKFLVLCLIIVQLSCNTLTKPLSISPGSGGEPATSEESSNAPPLEFTQDYFGKLTLLHDYWPAIAKAANLDPAIPAATVLSYFAYSPDGRYVAAAGCDEVRGNGEFYRDFYACDNTINGTVAHPFLFILDAHTEEVVATLPVGDQVGSVKTLEFSHDGDLLVYGLLPDSGYGGPMKVWNVASGQVEAVLSEDADDAHFSPDDFLIAYDEHGTTKIWDVQTQKSVVELPATEDYGTPYFSADGRTLLVDSWPVRTVYDATNWTKLSSTESPRTGLWHGDVSPDLTQEAICQYQVENEPVTIHDLATDKLLQTLSGNWADCGSLHFSPDGKVLFRADITGRKLVAWTIDDWQMFDESDTVSDKITPEDKYIGRVWGFASDGRSVLFKTFTRLALFGMP